MEFGSFDRPDRRKLLGTGALAFLTGGCTPRGYSIRFRVTLTCRVNGVLRQGSSVRVAELGSNGSAFPPTPIPAYQSILGEATPIDLGDGRYLFALMAGYEVVEGRLWRSDTFSLPLLAARRAGTYYQYDKSGKSQFLEELLSRPQSLTLKSSEWPMLGHFSDMSRMNTAELVPYDGIGRFFPDISDVVIVVESTTARVTRGVIEGLLPWFTERPTILSPGPNLSSHPEVLIPSDFIRSIR